MSQEKKAENPEEPNYVFPKFGPEDYGGYHLDKQSMMLWIGISVDPERHDFFGARAFMLSMEHALWQWYKEIGKQIRVRQELAAAGKMQPSAPPPNGKRGVLDILKGR